VPNAVMLFDYTVCD